MIPSLALDSVVIRNLEIFTEGAGITRIYRAQIPEGKAVAVKIIPRARGESQLAAQRRYFEGECELHRVVSHQNIRRVLFAEERASLPELGPLTPNGAFVLVHEWLEQSLRDRLSDGPLSPHEVLTLAEAIGSALTAIHDCDPPFLHRDVKPENILLPKSGVAGAQLIDFGIVRNVGTFASTSSHRGTYKYMAPEQFKGNAAESPASDQYALALVLWEVLTGEVPLFDPLLDPYDLYNLRDDNPELPSLVVEGQHCESLEEVFGRALSSNPNLRPESVAELTVLIQEAVIADGLLTSVEDSESFHLDPEWDTLDHRASGGAFWVHAPRDEGEELRRLTPGVRWRYASVRDAFFTKDATGRLRVGAKDAGGSARTLTDTRRRKANVPFMSPVRPNPILAAIVGPAPLPRTELTKKLWLYIKKHGLQDKRNRRLINADDKLRAVFGGKAQVSMFDMTKLVSKNLL